MLPVAIILILFVVAAMIYVSKSISKAKKFAMVAFGVTTVLSFIMTSLATRSSTAGGRLLRMVIGSEPWNLSVSVGPLEAFMACLFTGIGFLIVWASVSMIEHDVEEKRVPLYYSLMCLLIATLCGVVFFENVFNVFVFIEVSSFVAAGIVIIKNQPENLRAGLKYLALSILGSGFVLMGIVIFYTLTNSLTLSGIHAGLIGKFAGNENSVLYALSFITIGIMFKSALFPCHIWLPDAHGTAPSPSSAVLSSLVLKAFIVFYIKLLYVSIGSDFLAQDPNLSKLLSAVMVLGALAMLAGSTMAILQTDIKRMIAYSSVAQIGYIFLGLGMGNRLGLYAAVYHILAHAVTKACLFLVAGSIIEQTHNRRLDGMGGLGYQMPITMGLFTIGSLSMIGIPLFIGFNSKWNFAMGIMDSEKFSLMVVLAVSSLLNALYYLPVVVRAFFGKEATEAAAKGVRLERPFGDLLPIIVLACLVVIIAAFSGSVASLIRSGIESIW